MPEVTDVNEEKENNKKGSSNEVSNEALLQRMQEMSDTILELQKNKDTPAEGGANRDLVQELLKGLKGEKDDAQASSFEGYSPLPWDIEEDDLLPVGKQVRFVAFSSGYVIADSYIGGRPVRVPYNKVIEFEQFHIETQGSGKEVNLVHISAYICKHKSILRFLRESALYRIKYSEHISDAKNMNAQYAEKLTTIMSGLAKSNMVELRKMCTDNKIESSTDIAVMRVNLALKMAEKFKGNGLSIITGRMEESQLEAEMLNS